MPKFLSLFLLHTPACVPDAGFADFPVDDRPVGDHHELEGLLHTEDAEECLQCSRKKRKTSSDAYPEQPSISTLSLPPRPKARGCRRLIEKIAHVACCCRSRRRYQLLTRYRYHKQKKPYSAVSVHIERLTENTYEEDDLAGIPDLLEVIRLQSSGPTEVARAIRKKLKYGSVHRQLRALTILDAILQNGSERLQRTILSDPALLERLRIASADPVTDVDVKAKCRALFGQWVASSKESPGLEGAKSLYNQLPNKSKPQQQRREQSKILREIEDNVRREQEEDEDQPRSRAGSIAQPAGEPSVLRKSTAPIGLSGSSTFGTRRMRKDKKNKNKQFNLEREKPAILQSIAASSVASTNLNNALKLVNRESHRISDDDEVMKRFETCKQLRHQILRYIQLVESDEFLGGLIHANEELVNALMAYEILDKSIDDDSDSELEEAQHLSRQAAASDKSVQRDNERAMAGLKLESAPKQPPRPAQIAMPPRPSAKNWQAKQVESDSESEDEGEDEDSDDPFGDKNVVKTPNPEAFTARAGGADRKGYSWKEV